MQFLLLTLIFSLSRLINLLLLPIFNDEAIYLDWGWREIHTSLHFYSLYDSKPPLLLWIFGFLESVLPDPLLAGRLVSVAAGFLMALGIWKISRLIFDKKTAFLSFILYCITPIFLFYDRQALMETAVATAGVWSFYSFLLYINTRKLRYTVLTGALLGIGFWIKYSILLYAIAIIILFVIEIIKNKNKIKETTTLLFLIISTLCICLILFIQSDFFSALKLNAIYSLGVNEIFSFPFNLWLKNSFANLQIIFFFFTPFIFIYLLFGIALLLKSREKNKIFICLFVLILLALETLTVRSATIRYLASFLPILIVPAAYGFSLLIRKKSEFGLILIIFSLFPAIASSLLQIINPTAYINQMAKITAYSPTEYVSGITSGTGANAAIAYINTLVKRQKIVIVIAPHTGNPESALIAYFRKSRYVTVASVSSKEIGDTVNNVNCIETDQPTYFVARGIELENLNKYFSKIKTIGKEGREQTIDIYKIKTDCKGAKMKVSLTE